MRKGTLFGVALLAGTIIGAGIFSLPYVFSRLGLLYGFFYLLVFTLVYLVIHLMYAGVAEKHPGHHQFFYFASKYLPRALSEVASFAILGGLLFVLTIYLILAPTFVDLAFGYSGIGAMSAFWFLGSLFMFARLEWLGWAEFLGALAVVGIVAVVLIAGGMRPIATPLVQHISWPLFFLPFGPLLFSLSGRPAISKVIEEFHRAHREGKTLSLAKIICWGTAIPGIIYLLFVVGILRLNPDVSPEALNSLNFLSPALLSLLGVMGLVALWTSYFMIGINVKDILRFDVKWSPFGAGVLAVAAPLLLYFAGFKDFLGTVSFTGGIFLALEGIFVIAMWRRAFPESKWRWISWPFFVVFLVAFVYETVKIFS